MSNKKNSPLLIVAILLLFQHSNQSMAAGSIFNTVFHKKAEKTTVQKTVEQINKPVELNTNIDTDKAIDFNSITIDVKNKTKQKLEVDKPVQTIKKSFIQTSEEGMKQAFEIQKKQDIDDIKSLWESTVERNSVIKFAIKKLALPPEQRRVHSSVMARTLSTLISGASMMPGMFGADRIISTASAASGTITNRIIRSKSLPKNMPITDTELIQLAGLVEQLQNELIKNYYDYKSSIEGLKECRSKLMIYNKNYATALKEKNEPNILVSSAMYDNQSIDEIKIKQMIKLHRLELERLAGPEIVNNLNLTKLTNLVFETASPSLVTGGK
jgi:hypothetical protein